MPTESTQCRWTDRDGDERGCSHPVTHDDGTHCIFHAQEKDPREFRDALARLIRQWRNREAWRWDFSGFVFIDVERENKPIGEQFNLFRRSIFPKQSMFSDATFLVDVTFKRATFHEVVFLDRTLFMGSVDLEYARFDKDAFFYEAVFRVAAEFKHEAILEFA